MCLTHKKDINKYFVEKHCQLRTSENYKIHLALGNVSETGISFECVFHRTKHYNVLKNLFADIMHDWFGGVLRYDIAKVLYEFIFVKKYLTLTMLNNCIRAFNYGNESSIKCRAHKKWMHYYILCGNVSASKASYSYTGGICT